jgi:hypothetical protein
VLWRAAMMGSHRTRVTAYACLALSGAALSLGLTACEPPEPEDLEPEEAAEDEDALAPGCAKNARVFTYDPVGWTHLVDAFAKNPSPCADYYIHLPAIAGDKKRPRGGAAVDGIHQKGGKFHAAAEFHWGGWSSSSPGLTWFQKGAAFRIMMKEAGYVDGRDTWAINELPSTVRGDPKVRKNVRDLVRGLYQGAPGDKPMGGLVFIVGMGSPTTNFSVYKPLLENWLTDAAFWKDMNAHVRWWGQEVYARPLDYCVEGATVAKRAEHLNDFTMHPALLAEAGPAAAQEARKFFNESYAPILNGAFRAEAYNTTTISFDNMKAFVSTEVFATRSFANNNDQPDWRIGIAWNEQPEGVTEAKLTELADRIAAAVHDAYPDDDRPLSDVCGTSGAYTLCHCNMTGAAFNEGWSTFRSW